MKQVLIKLIAKKFLYFVLFFKYVGNQEKNSFELKFEANLFASNRDRAIQRIKYVAYSNILVCLNIYSAI